MVQCKVLKQLELLEARKFDDPDIVEDLEFIQQKLQESVQDLRYIFIAPAKNGIHVVLFLFLHESIYCGYSLEMPC